jgi:hypothetical protein
LFAFFNSLKGKLFLPSLLMKRPRAAIIHVSFMTSFLLDGLAMLHIASTFADHEAQEQSGRYTEDTLG